MRLITLSNVTLPVNKAESELIKIAAKKLGKQPSYFAIKKKSLDARDKRNIRFVYTIEFSSEPKPQEKREIERLPKGRLPEKPVLVVGSGPAGLFCAIRLIERGILPLVIERGGNVEEREKATRLFFSQRTLDENTNIQFGEGGAGTFSDGKLNTQTHSAWNKEVLETFVRFGAPKEILYLNKPHIGSDKLKTVVKNMREYILAKGGEVRFHTRLEDISVKEGRLVGATLYDLTEKKEEKLDVSALILAIGHSARDTFEKLLSRGVTMRAKDFAVGVRIEHLQAEIGKTQYGEAYSLLPAADYKLVSHVNQRSAFTFCMCPGGFVMPAASEAGGVVTNGMSNYARDGKNANSALIAQVTRADFGDERPLAGIEFQRQIERAAYHVGGRNYAAPVQRVGDFLEDKESDFFGAVAPTYAAGTAFADLRAVLPSFVADTLKQAIKDMDKRLKGFACPDALLTAAETRTSSPVRIERTETLQSVSMQALFPCGEGAGYAGGITSSAADGLRVADAVYAYFLQ
ncbi:MAG: hypothetical protein E7355_01800 [Clostridiales bacterium]|nr:hypothetical protein [Clostridiales bacterium]